MLNPTYSTSIIDPRDRSDLQEEPHFILYVPGSETSLVKTVYQQPYVRLGVCVNVCVGGCVCVCVCLCVCLRVCVSV